MNTATQVPWDFFPLIMCINLREREDRFAEVREELKRVGLQRVEFFRSERQPDKERGCWESHMACLSRMVERGVPYALIMEDDIAFSPDHAVHMNRVIDFLRTRPGWKFLHLGGFIFREVERIGGHFLRGGIMCTHGYVVTLEHAKLLLQESANYSGFSIDTLYTIVNRNDAIVHLNPLAAVQRPSKSDGSWDKRDISHAGWLGQAMIYTSLSFREKLAFKGLPLVEKIKIENGRSFFKVYRHIMKRSKRRKPGVPQKSVAEVTADAMKTGRFETVEL